MVSVTLPVSGVPWRAIRTRPESATRIGVPAGTVNGICCGVVFSRFGWSALRVAKGWGWEGVCADATIERQNRRVAESAERRRNADSRLLHGGFPLVERPSRFLEMLGMRIVGFRVYCGRCSFEQPV